MLLIVRHPETDANISGRFVGQGESPYTAEGRRQARRLPRKLARFRPDTVWSSPLQRARVVAQRTSRLAGVPLRVDQRLIELDFGQAHGLTWEEITEAGIPFNYRSADTPVAPEVSPGRTSRPAWANASTRCVPQADATWWSRMPV